MDDYESNSNHYVYSLATVERVFPVNLKGESYIAKIIIIEKIKY